MSLTGLLGIGGTWLALSPPTRVTSSPDIVARAAPSVEGSLLPRPVVLPIIRATF